MQQFVFDPKTQGAGSTWGIAFSPLDKNQDYFVMTDGTNYKVLPEAKDYKRIGEGDTGLNTGGMGAISPVPFAHETFMQKVKEKINSNLKVDTKSRRPLMEDTTQ